MKFTVVFYIFQTRKSQTIGRKIQQKSRFFEICLLYHRLYSISEFIQICLTNHVAFVFQAMLRESWLDDMMHVLEQEESGDDISTADSTLKRHEAISHDIQSRVRPVKFCDTKELTLFTRNRRVCDKQKNDAVQKCFVKFVVTYFLYMYSNNSINTRTINHGR